VSCVLERLELCAREVCAALHGEAVSDISNSNLGQNPPQSLWYQPYSTTWLSEKVSSHSVHAGFAPLKQKIIIYDAERWKDFQGPPLAGGAVAAPLQGILRVPPHQIW